MAGRRICTRSLFRMFCSNIPTEVNAPGLSKNVVSVPAGKVGPGASKMSEYKNPEYFCYTNMSYFEAEVEMNKYRLQQPSNRTPLKK